MNHAPDSGSCDDTVLLRDLTYVGNITMQFQLWHNDAAKKLITSSKMEVRNDG